MSHQPPSFPREPSGWRARYAAIWKALFSPASNAALNQTEQPNLPEQTQQAQQTKQSAHLHQTDALVPAAGGEVLAEARSSNAETARAYRRDAAKHLYARNAERIYKGMLPPQLYAIGVLNVTLDSSGRVLQLHWLRAPTHAPEVVAEIERTVHSAAPFPRPVRLESVVYTDTWLWDASGSFQLDTLTEGQQ